MTPTTLVFEQLAAYAPLLQLDSPTARKYRTIINWLIQLSAFGLFASHLRLGNRGLWAMMRLALFPTAHIKSGGAYSWVSTYLHQDPDVQRQLRDRVISAADEEGSETRDPRRLSTVIKPRNKAWSKDGVIAVVDPVLDQELVVRFQDQKLWVTRKSGGASGRNQWYIATWYWNRHLVDEFIVAAYKLQHAKSDQELLIFSHSPLSGWTGPTRRSSRAWASVILPKTVKDDLLRDVEEFMSDEERSWYAAVGIPHRRGYLLHGPPGTGKTTLATALASKLRLDLYCVTPSAAGMDDSRLQKCFAACPAGSMLFIEDIDCALPESDASRDRGASRPNHASDGKSKAPVERTRNRGSTVTLSGLLNAIDGICSQENSILLASTNHIELLDEALCRPGRFDVHVAFSYATHEQIAGLFKHFYALEYASKLPAINGLPSSSRFANHKQLDEAATRFANTVVNANVEMSLATIQGYLLLYKRDPVMAQDKAGEWLEGSRVARAASVAGQAVEGV